MTNFLIKLFVKNRTEVKNLKVRNQYAMLSSITGIIVNILLSVFKLFIGVISGSMSIISDALNNVTDAGSSVVTMIGFKMAQKQGDKDHPWGHGRMEYITAFIVDIIIILVGIELFQTSMDKILHPSLPNISNITVILLVIAIFTKLWLFMFYRKIAKTIDSPAIKATSYDSISDAVSTIVVLLSAIVARYFQISIDGYVSILVSIFILFTGVKAVKETIDILIGSKPDEEFVKEVFMFTKRYSMIVGIHDMMVHDYGPGRKIISFHAEVPSDCDISKAHDVVDRMEQDIYNEFGCITTVHMDPIVVNNEEINNMRKLTESIVKEINPQFSIHDFRMTDGGERINLIFDLVIPSEKEKEKERIEKIVKEKVKKVNNRCYVVMKIEHAYV